MKLYGKPILKRFGEGGLEGYSLMQFIETSTIIMHMDEVGDRAFIDIFSCKKISDKTALAFTKKYFKAKGVSHKTIYRGL
jgi:S-adenosylmethionine/arginine decarboxylase-like enzyme